MANYHTSSCEALVIRDDAKAKAEEALEKALAVRDQAGEDLCVKTSTDALGNTVFLFGDEDGNFNIEATETAVKAIIQAAKIKAPFIASWSFTCDKSRPAGFGGGAFLVRYGKPTVWTDARTHLANIVRRDFFRREKVAALTDFGQIEQQKEVLV